MAETCKPPHDDQRGRGLAVLVDTARSRTVPVATSLARTAGIANTTSSANARTFMVRPPLAMRASWR